MLCRVKIIAVLFSLLAFEAVAAQELLFVPPILNAAVNKDSATSFVLTTMDYARFQQITEVKPYVSACQIIDADLSWPPRWYTTTPVYTDEMYKDDEAHNNYNLTLIVDARVQSGYFSFFKLISCQSKGVSQLEAPDISGYILLNQKMEPVDTVKSNTKRRSLFYHDFRINEKGERMVDLKRDTYMDLRDYTSDDKDSAVHCLIDYIQILDAKNKVLFSWNPLDHVNPDLFHYNQILKDEPATGQTKSLLLEWTRLTSALYDYDGNILYSMRRTGIGKCSRTDGHVMWEIDNENLPMKLENGILNWDSPHDFNYLYNDDSSVTYSIFSDGNQDALASAIVFKQNKQTQKFSIVKQVKFASDIHSRGQGNLDYKQNGEYIISYGNRYEPDGQPDFRNEMEYGKNGKVYGVYMTPKANSIFKAHKLEDWPRPPRPVITLSGDKLEASGNYSGDWTWYKLSGANNSTITFAGTGKTIVPQNNAIYCVEAKYGIGYAVSRPFAYHYLPKDEKNHPY